MKISVIVAGLIAIARMVLPKFVKNPNSVAKEEAILNTVENVAPVITEPLDAAIAKKDATK